MKKILSVRYPLAKMILLPTTVQGDNAKFEIVNNIQKADELGIKNNEQNIANLIIVGRGGGSIEDLWAFNEEIVADAIFNATTPIISSVGHESDFVISDLVADVRASTPSNAIEIATPNINDLRFYLDTLSDDYIQKFKRILFVKQQMQDHLISSFEQHSLDKRFDFVQSTITQLKLQYRNSYEHILKVKSNDINILNNSFELNHPNKKDKKGFVQISHNNKIINISDIEVDDTVSLQNSEFELECEVLSKKRI